MRDSWNVKESAWPFVSVQKAEEDRREREMLDSKCCLLFISSLNDSLFFFFFSARAPSQMSERLSSNGKRSKSKGGGSKGKVLKGPPAKPVKIQIPSPDLTIFFNLQSFDPSVPHWTMKVVTLEEQKVRYLSMQSSSVTTCFRI